MDIVCPVVKSCSVDLIVLLKSSFTEEALFQRNSEELLVRCVQLSDEGFKDCFSKIYSICFCIFMSISISENLVSMILEIWDNQHM